MGMIKIEDLREDQILFHDVETDSQYAPYAKLKIIGACWGFEGEPFLVEGTARKREYRAALRSDKVLTVGFNSKNFDNIVLERHGYPINELTDHDVYLMAKACSPVMPSYSQKFLSFHFFGDPHWPEMEMREWLAHHPEKGIHEAPRKLLRDYNFHDLIQLRKLFQLYWEIVQREKHWAAYRLDLSVGSPLLEMETVGGLYIDSTLCGSNIKELEDSKAEYELEAYHQSDCQVINPNSSKQLGAYLDSEGFALELSANGDFSVRKADLVDIREKNPVAECAYQIRKINGNLKYFRNYLAALNHDTDSLRSEWIPIQLSISNARTRRFTSNSLYKLNFQNPNEEAKAVQVVPKGWLGWWIDSSQVENVVHIYESQDTIRRKDYERNPEWNEYVWLCNYILGGKPRSKSALDSIPSDQVPNWSIYKLYKTAKLALNFGMGVDKFCKTVGLKVGDGKKVFEKIHRACPAIHSLQERVARDISEKGYVQDVFGHIYSGKAAYKVTAYLIQGCGTGSLPKAQLRANYETQHKWFGDDAHLSVTTHDEQTGRIDLRCGTTAILQGLQELMFNMTALFSPKFDNIPLRAKLYLSKTTAAKHIEVNIQDHESIRTIVKGDPCVDCEAAGHLGNDESGKRIQCAACKGIGYTLPRPRKNSQNDAVSRGTKRRNHSALSRAIAD
jgi:hypothetical protein